MAETQWRRLVEKAIDEFKATTGKDLEALDKRVRSLEDLRHWVLGAATIVGLVAGAIGKTILESLHIIPRS